MTLKNKKTKWACLEQHIFLTKTSRVPSDGINGLSSTWFLLTIVKMLLFKNRVDMLQYCKASIKHP